MPAQNGNRTTYGPYGNSNSAITSARSDSGNITSVSKSTDWSVKPAYLSNSVMVDLMIVAMSAKPIGPSPT
jgi:hypothetical protein